MKKLDLALDKVRENWFGVLVDDEDRLVASAFGANKQILEKYLREYSWKTSDLQPTREENPLAAEMASLFYGGKASSSVKLSPQYVSPFQSQVYHVLGRIPVGKITTYGLVSKEIRSGPRAVGSAVASNPWPLFVPCHRVVTSGLSVGNYSMCGTPDAEGSFTKRQLLEREGVPFLGVKIAPSALWNPSGE